MNLEFAFQQYLLHIQINEGKSKRTVVSYKEDLLQYMQYLKEKEINDSSDIDYH
ncbi:MAG: site-specific integrase, partial [Solobacterium sp.]|nr:site-specific integrase [Solobacterium sp.]